MIIPFLLEAAAVLATFVHPNHIVYLCSWGLTHLPPTCNSKLFGYKIIRKSALGAFSYLKHIRSKYALQETKKSANADFLNSIYA
ncbi:hypothetical protein CGT71_06335 [Vibrio cholerae]|nr:hypothetical protein CGT71_06335 [Vibrio cholerae]